MRSLLRTMFSVLIIVAFLAPMLSMTGAGRGGGPAMEVSSFPGPPPPSPAPVVSEDLVRQLIWSHLATVMLLMFWSMGVLFLFVGTVWLIVRALGRSEYVERSVYVVKEGGPDPYMFSPPPPREALPGSDRSFRDLRASSARYLED